MTIHSYKTELWLPERRERVFSFFADARNLEAITPPWLNFEIVGGAEIEMRAGALIDYRLRVHHIPLRWRTEIRVWEPAERFVDVQLRGPYRVWEHTHTFADRDGGTLCRDEVRYAVPGGELVHRFFVRRDIEAIFAYRAVALREILQPGG